MARYEKGQSGNPAGKPKGSKNKARFDVTQLMKDVNFNPFLKLADLAQNSRSQKVQCEAASQLAGYCAAKLKAVEVDKKEEGALEISINIGDKKSQVSNTQVSDTKADADKI